MALPVLLVDLASKKQMKAKQTTLRLILDICLSLEQLFFLDYHN